MRILQVLQVVVLVAVLVMLCSIRIAVEKLAVNVLEPARVTEVKHVYRYNVESYGTIRLDDRLVGVVVKR